MRELIISWNVLVTKNMFLYVQQKENLNYRNYLVLKKKKSWQLKGKLTNVGAGICLCIKLQSMWAQHIFYIIWRDLKALLHVFTFQILIKIGMSSYFMKYT